jgi:hypothetical protein
MSMPRNEIGSEMEIASMIYEAARLVPGVISGLLYNHEDKGRIPAVVGRIPGVEKVQLDVTLVPARYD